MREVIPPLPNKIHSVLLKHMVNVTFYVYADICKRVTCSSMFVFFHALNRAHAALTSSP
jgi:hypothetical protein